MTCNTTIQHIDSNKYGKTAKKVHIYKQQTMIVKDLHGPVGQDIFYISRLQTLNASLFSKKNEHKKGICIVENMHMKIKLTETSHSDTQ